MLCFSRSFYLQFPYFIFFPSCEFFQNAFFQRLHCLLKRFFSVIDFFPARMFSGRFFPMHFWKGCIVSCCIFSSLLAFPGF